MMWIKYVHAIISISIFLRKESFLWFTQTYSLVYYPKKKKKILTRWIFFTFQWNHCYFMWVLLDSNIKAMQRMFENEKQVLFLFSSLFHVIQFKTSTCWNFKHYTREIWFDMKFSGKKIHSYLKTTLYIHKIQRHEKFNLSCHKILSFFILFFIFQ